MGLFRLAVHGISPRLGSVPTTPPRDRAIELIRELADAGLPYGFERALSILNEVKRDPALQKETAEIVRGIACRLLPHLTGLLAEEERMFLKALSKDPALFKALRGMADAKALYLSCNAHILSSHVLTDYLSDEDFLRLNERRLLELFIALLPLGSMNIQLEALLQKCNPFISASFRPALYEHAMQAHLEKEFLEMELVRWVNGPQELGEMRQNAAQKIRQCRSSGALNLSFHHLTTLPQVWDLPQFKTHARLNIAGNRFIELPHLPSSLLLNGLQIYSDPPGQGENPFSAVQLCRPILQREAPTNLDRALAVALLPAIDPAELTEEESLIALHLLLLAWSEGSLSTTAYEAAHTTVLSYLEAVANGIAPHTLDLRECRIFALPNIFHYPQFSGLKTLKIESGVTIWHSVMNNLRLLLPELRIETYRETEIHIRYLADLKERLGIWQRRAGSNEDLGYLVILPQEVQNAVNNWLHKLQCSSDFRKCPGQFCQMVCTLLAYYRDHETVRPLFFDEIERAVGYCEDRAAAILDVHYVSFKLATLSDESDAVQLDTMIRAAKREALSVAISKKVGNQPEAVEVHLFYSTRPQFSRQILTFITHGTYAEKYGDRQQTYNKDHQITPDYLQTEIDSNYVDHLLTMDCFIRFLEQHSLYGPPYLAKKEGLESEFLDDDDDLNADTRAIDLHVELNNLRRVFFLKLQRLVSA